jgi:hypothetical protein
MIASVVQLPAALADIAGRQFGVVELAQLRQFMTIRQVRGLVAKGVLVRLHRGVFRFAGATPTFRQRAMAACLAIGGDVAISYLAAARLWGVSDWSGPLDLTIPPTRRSAVGGCVHRQPLPPGDVTRRWGIPLTTPARTVLDLSTRLPGKAIGALTDELIRTRHMTMSDLSRRLESGEPLARLNRANIGLILHETDLRGGSRPGASVREDWVFDAIARGGLPLPARNVLVDVGGVVRELDLAYLKWKIGVEYDGWGVHGDRTHFHSDRDKVALLQLAGWIILQVTSRWTPELVVARVSHAIALRGGTLAGVDSLTGSLPA